MILIRLTGLSFAAIFWSIDDLEPGSSSVHRGRLCLVMCFDKVDANRDIAKFCPVKQHLQVFSISYTMGSARPWYLLSLFKITKRTDGLN